MRNVDIMVGSIFAICWDIAWVGYIMFFCERFVYPGYCYFVLGCMLNALGMYFSELLERLVRRLCKINK